MWAGNWTQQYGDWAAIPIIAPLQPESYGLQGSSKPLAKLTLVLELDEIHMSMLRVVIQAQILAEAGDQSLKRKGCRCSTVGNEYPRGGPTAIQGYSSCVWLHPRLQGVLTRFGLDSSD